LADALGSGQRAQIVGELLALLCERGFDEFEECGGVADLQVCVLAGEAQADESGGDFRRRGEGVGRKVKGEVWTGVEPGEDGEVAVFLAARLGGEALGDFELNDDVGLVDSSGELEEMLEDRRGDVIGKIAVDAHAASGGEGGEVEFEDVAGNDGEMGMFVREALEAADERGIEFDGDDGSAAAEEMLGHFAVAGADFEPEEIFGRELRGALHAMGRDADRAGDLFAPIGVAEEVLT